MDNDIIYHEKFAAKGFILILSPLAVFMFITLLYHLFVETVEPFLFWTIFLFGMFLFFLVLTIGFGTFSITMTNDNLSFGFKIKKHTTPLTHIIDAQPDDVSAAKYGGFGIRVTRIRGKNRLVYNTIGTKRVLLTKKEGKFPEVAFSTKNPEEVINVIRAQLTLTE